MGPQNYLKSSLLPEFAIARIDNANKQVDVATKITSIILHHPQSL